MEERWKEISIAGKKLKIFAPASEIGMKNWLKIMRMILESTCFRFKVEEKNEKVVPRRVWE